MADMQCPLSVPRDEQMFLALERARASCLVTDLITSRGHRREQLTCPIIRADNQASSGRRTVAAGSMELT